MLVLKTEQYHIRCGSHTGVKAAATAVPLLVVRVFGAGRGRWRWVVLAAVTPVRDMPYKCTGPCCVSRMDVLWISVAGINSEGSGSSVATARVICWGQPSASSAARVLVRRCLFETREV